MNKHELKSLLENIYEAMILPTLGQELYDNPDRLNPKPPVTIDPNSWDPSIPHWFRRLAEIMQDLQKPQ